MSTYTQLDVRINQKIDTLANWNNSTIILNNGEFAIATIPAQEGVTTNGTYLTPPAVAVKVGNGSDLFKDLPWIQSTAGDVYAWAKKPALDFDDLDASFKNELATYIQEEQIDDTNTTYQFTYSNNKLVIKSKEKTDSAYNNTVLTVDLSGMMKKVTGATGNLAQFDANGQVVDSGKKIGDYLTTSTAAGTYAKQSDLSSLEGTVTSQGTRLTTAESKITTLESKITGVTGAMHFLGISTTNPSTGTVTVGGKAVTAAKGDVVVYKTTNPVADIEYVYDGSTWVELGDVTAEAQRITTLENTVGNSSKGLVKNVADNTSAIAELEEAISDANITTAVQSVSGVTTKKTGTNVEVTGVPVNLLKDVAGNVLVFNCGTASTVI